MSDRMTLEIRHRISVCGDRYVVIENFGHQPELRWELPTHELAKALVKERRDMLCKMVANISERAKQAVEDARFIDRIKAGHA